MTDSHITTSRLANVGAQLARRAFVEYMELFHEVTRRASGRFAAQDWAGMQEDASERLEIYRRVRNDTVLEMREVLGERTRDRLLWASMKAVYSGLIAEHENWELAETFFNSITRLVFGTVGVDPVIEFVDTDFQRPPAEDRRPVYRTYHRPASTPALVRAILRDFRLDAPYRSMDADAVAVSGRIERKLRESGALRVVERVEVVDSIFYRGKGAYVIGRLFSGSHLLPFVIALLYRRNGVEVDAVLLDENDVSVLFSFTRSYFHVDEERSHDLVRFLSTLMPRKRPAELYISIGHNKHGKTLLYRDLLSYLASSSDRFEIARGVPGMVMTVFTLPGFDMVFKVIRDEFDAAKAIDREGVRRRYQMVFHHDRAGRLVDAQEFDRLEFARARFTDELLEELRREASLSVEIDETHVVIRHAYVERRVIPLNVYLEEADPEAAQAAIVDYGNAIKDLARTNIFPGDLLLKNFGVTRHGRVVFYDYDELAFLTDCVFRKLPVPRTFEDELSDEPWFAVRENDIFPEEFMRFLGLTDVLREVFTGHHGDLLDAAFWQSMQEAHRTSEIVHLYPYRESRRLIRTDP